MLIVTKLLDDLRQQNCLQLIWPAEFFKNVDKGKINSNYRSQDIMTLDINTLGGIVCNIAADINMHYTERLSSLAKCSQRDRDD